LPLPLDVNRRNGAPGRVGLQPAHECVGQERDIRMLECRVDADDLSVGLAIDEARVAIEGVAADAGAGVLRLAVLLVEQNAERKRKRMIAAPPQAVPETPVRAARARRAGNDTAGSRAVRSDPRHAPRGRGRDARPLGHDLLPVGAMLTLLCSEAWHIYCVLLEPAAMENAAPMRDVIQLGALDIRSTRQQSVCVGGGEHSYQGR